LDGRQEGDVTESGADRAPRHRQAEGSIRPDADARDVILLIGYLTRLEQAEWEARARHLPQIVLDGLCQRDQGRMRQRDQGRN
jgi:hypothetical protein